MDCVGMLPGDLLLDEAGRRLGRHVQVLHERIVVQLFMVQLFIDFGELSPGPLMVRHDCFNQS